ncbi:hypothetical protein GSI_02432 [Ganoderma sinense ZZ0214-1]|uniref:Uncharacterized protein n=1 Tax=Ganoderma sinense ZZ0214-1 TaxID=1077348 RepID=A0A2G8SPN7_9APHY|nr:hypothetical protein GSI_02432 [Ganoderma sinense ZZ0214-1]
MTASSTTFQIQHRPWPQMYLVDIHFNLVPQTELSSRPKRQPNHPPGQPELRHIRRAVHFAQALVQRRSLGEACGEALEGVMLPLCAVRVGHPAEEERVCPERLLRLLDALRDELAYRHVLRRAQQPVRVEERRARTPLLLREQRVLDLPVRDHVAEPAQRRRDPGVAFALEDAKQRVPRGRDDILARGDAEARGERLVDVDEAPRAPVRHELLDLAAQLRLREADGAADGGDAAVPEEERGDAAGGLHALRDHSTRAHLGLLRYAVGERREPAELRGGGRAHYVSGERTWRDGHEWRREGEEERVVSEPPVAESSGNFFDES